MHKKDFRAPLIKLSLERLNFCKTYKNNYSVSFAIQKEFIEGFLRFLNFNLIIAKWYRVVL